MQDIPFLGKRYQIYKINCGKEMCLSDFIYNADNGIEYNMIIDNNLFDLQINQSKGMR